MNNQMFFYPMYPQYNDNIIDDNRGNEFYSPKETLMYGNISKKEYKPYKNYKPNKVECNNQDMLMLISLLNQCHDLRLYLDIYPDNKKLIDEYVFYNKKLLEFEEKFKNSDNNPYGVFLTKNEKTNYVFTPSPWIR